MARMKFQHVPLAHWPRKPTPRSEWRSGVFRSKLEASITKLSFELSELGAINPVLLTTAHLGANDIGINGLPRLDVAPKETPGVIIEFYAFRAGKDGPREQMQFACDTYRFWTHNLHAIALTLESLRAIDRYGATSAGEQYAGFKALPAPGGAMTVEAAATVLAATPGVGVTAKMLVDSKQTYQEAYRVAAKRSHVDTGGTEAMWQQLQQAAAVLRAHHHL